MYNGNNYIYGDLVSHSINYHCTFKTDVENRGCKNSGRLKTNILCDTKDNLNVASGKKAY